MNYIEMCKALYKAIDAGKMDVAASYLSDDFEFSGPVPEPIGREEFLGMQTLLHNAFPDWSFNRRDDYKEMDGKVTASIQITGTHTGDLDLSSMGMPVIPATGEAISLPEDVQEFSFSGNKICALRMNTPVDGGMAGLLKQLGVVIPALV